MFIVCNYLDVSRSDEIPDGFKVEECSAYSPELEGYCIICREHRVSNVMDWARNNMTGSKFSMFEKQMGLNKEKAMCFLKAKGSIKSFTEEFVISVGGIEQFKDTYGVKEPEVEEEPKEEVKDEPKGEVAEAEVTAPVVESVPTTSKVVRTEPTLSESIIPMEQPVAEQVIIPEPQRVVAPMEVEEVVPTMAELRREPQTVCHQDCIYQTDGTFKGFSEGQVLKLLSQLKEFDKRVMMDDLDPEYVLTADEVHQATQCLDAVAPSVFKSFMLRELDSANTEIDRIRVSAIMNHLTAFITTLNKE